MKTFYRTIFCLTLSLPVGIFAQSQILKFGRLTIEDGLSHNTVRSIYQDSRGFIWFGTDAGLNRYDGYQFTVFKHNPNNPNSLSMNKVWSIIEDGSNRIWLGTHGGGLNCFDPATETFRHWKHAPNDPRSLSNNFITSLFLDSLNMLWIATNDGLNRLALSQNSMQEPVTFTSWLHDPQNSNSLSGAHIESIYGDPAGMLWLAVGARGVDRFDTATEIFTNYRYHANYPYSPTENYIDEVYVDRRRAVWLATHGSGLKRYDRETGLFASWQQQPDNPNSLSSDYLDSIWEDHSITGAFWIGTDGSGLNRFDPVSGHFQQWTNDPAEPTSLSNNHVSSLYEDRSGLLWVGTDGGGVSLLTVKQRSNHKFTHWKYKPGASRGLVNNDIQAFYEDPHQQDEIIWIGTKDGLNRLERRRETFSQWQVPSSATESLNRNYITSILKTQPQFLWLGTYGDGLKKLDLTTGTFTHYLYHPKDVTGTLRGRFVLSLFEDSSGMLWIGTHGAGLNRYDPKTNVFSNWDIEQNNPRSLNNNDVRCIYEDKSKILWLGTAGGGINKFDPQNGRFSHVMNEPGDFNSLNNNFVNCFYEDSQGRLWIGTDGGLNQYIPENNAFIHYTEQDGLPNQVICGILEDDQHNLWLSTQNGLHRFNPETETFRHYDARDGLQSNQFNSGAYLKSKSGEMFFGGGNGFNSFYPDSIRDNLHIPPVFITDFRISNESVPIRSDSSAWAGGPVPLRKHISLTDEIVLSHDQNVFSFEFAALDYNAPGKNEYTYKMEGFDEQWIYSGNRRFVTYTNLDPGAYRFRVKGSNNDGIWNEEGASIRLIITPPWWQTWWAFTLLALLLAAALYGYLRFQLSKVRLTNDLERQRFEAQKLREVDEMKSHFFANISHEFRTPLTLILGQIKNSLTIVQETKLLKNLQMAARNGERLLRLINQLLDLSKLEAGRMTLQAEPGDIVALLKRIVAAFESLATQKNIELRLEVKPPQGGSPQVYFDSEKMEKVLINLLSNAFKFTGEDGEIAVEVNYNSLQRPLSKLSKGGPKGVEIRVSNTGIGISPEQLPHIFDRFYQADGGSARKFEGSGIGLALVQELIELHYGAVSVESEVDGKTTFAITLPLGRAHLREDEIIESPAGAKESALTEISHALTEQTSVQSPTLDLSEPAAQDIDADSEQNDDTIVLVVEDHRDLREFIREQLETDFTIIEAENGRTGVQKAEAAIPDLVISDVMMPGMDGYQLCQALKNNEKTNHIPIILLTAKAASGDKIEGLQSGADDYLLKPFNSEELKIRVSNLIKIRQQLREKFSDEMLLKPGKVTVSSIHQKFFERLMSIIEDHFDDEDFGVESLANKIGMSRGQLHRKLKAMTNRSPSEFVRTFRLQRAAELLTKDAGNIAEIAYQVGFNSQAYFTRCFQEHFGCSPRVFKKRESPSG